jgi:hypothetical protein
VGESGPNVLTNWVLIMSASAYLLLELVKGSGADAVERLRDRPGVIRLDVLEGQPDLIVLFEAADRMQLAERISQALATLDSVTSDLHLLINRNNSY